MSVTGLLTTTAGQAAIIADLAATAELVITHVAWGDANGAPYNPNPAQVALVNERYRAGIASVAVVAGALVIEAVIPADTPDGSARPSHGFNVAEAAIFGTTGGAPVMLGVARMSNGFKPAPASGQAAIATFRFKLAVANPASIAVVIDPQAQLILGRNVRPFWVTVDGHLNDPPVNPAQGATYVIGAAPTGAWAGFGGRLAQWVGVWSLASVPAGHIVADNAKAESDPLRYLKFVGGVWVSAAATDVAFGFSRRATDAEAAAGADVNAYVTPATVITGGSIPGRTQVFTASGTFTVPAGVTQVEVICIGGGGGGGASNNSSAGGTIPGNCGGGGGGGGYAYKRVSGLTPGSTVAATVGAGGAAAANVAGGAGGTSSFAAHCSATGGGGGQFGSASIGAGGTGGTGSGGDINIAGGNGGSTGTNNAGTPSQSEILNIFNKGGTAAGGFATASLGGTGAAGRGFGCGGTGASGGSGLSGGAGAPGVVIVRW